MSDFIHFSFNILNLYVIENSVKSDYHSTGVAHIWNTRNVLQYKFEVCMVEIGAG